MQGGWFKNIERARTRAQEFLNKVAALYQTNSIVVGLVASVELDKLWSVTYCKIYMKRAARYELNGKLRAEIDEGIFWVNKPELILSMADLAKRFPKVYEQVLPKIKGGVW